MRYRTLIALLLSVCLSFLTACSVSPDSNKPLTYEDIVNTGLANNCPELPETARGFIALDRNESYILTDLCLKPTTYFIKEEPTNKRQKAEFVQGKKFTPKGKNFDQLLEIWKDLKTDDGAKFDTEIKIDCSSLEPHVSWGTNPGQVVGVNSSVPDPNDFDTPEKKSNAESALEYMGLEAGQKISDVKIDRVFIGSCTNGRLEDLRAAAKIIDGKKVSKNVNAMVVPGSGIVKMLAEKEGLDKVFINSGFEWREAGCSMCLAMNPNKLSPQERCASTSNRNFEGRQGKDGRTHLVSPEMAAAAAIEGHFVDVRNWK